MSNILPFNNNCRTQLSSSEKNPATALAVGEQSKSDLTVRRAPQYNNPLNNLVFGNCNRGPKGPHGSPGPISSPDSHGSPGPDGGSGPTAPGGPQGSPDSHGSPGPDGGLGPNSPSRPTRFS